MTILYALLVLLITMLFATITSLYDLTIQLFTSIPTGCLRTMYSDVTLEQYQLTCMLHRNEQDEHDTLKRDACCQVPHPEHELPIFHMQ